MINQMQQFQPFQPTYQPISDLRFMNVPAGANQTISELMLPFGEQTLKGLSQFSTGFSPDYAPRHEAEKIEEAVEPQNVAKNIEPYSYSPDSLYNFQPPDYSLGGVGALIGGWGGAKKAYDWTQGLSDVTTGTGGGDFLAYGPGGGPLSKAAGFDPGNITVPGVKGFPRAGETWSGGMWGGAPVDTLYGITPFETSGVSSLSGGADLARGTLGETGFASIGEGVEGVSEATQLAEGSGHPYLAYLNIFLDTLSGGEGSRKITGNTYADSVARAAAAYYSFGLSEIFYAIL